MPTALQASPGKARPRRDKTVLTETGPGEAGSAEAGFVSITLAVEVRIFRLSFDVFFGPCGKVPGYRGRPGS